MHSDPADTSQQAVASFLAAGVFPTLFKDLNEPVDFANTDRMEGKEQPKAILEANTTGSYEENEKR